MQTLEHAKAAGDALSIVAMLGALAGALPWIAAALSALYTAIRIWESRTAQGWRARLRRFLGWER